MYKKNKSHLVRCFFSSNTTSEENGKKRHLAWCFFCLRVSELSSFFSYGDFFWYIKLKLGGIVGV